MSMNTLAADAQEGMSAFVEKRPPHWWGADASRVTHPAPGRPR